ncbi:hypothetical protein ADUPG1_001062, partial [Aduncisulcus paluster]
VRIPLDLNYAGRIVDAPVSHDSREDDEGRNDESGEDSYGVYAFFQRSISGAVSEVSKLHVIDNHALLSAQSKCHVTVRQGCKVLGTFTFVSKPGDKEEGKEELGKEEGEEEKEVDDSRSEKSSSSLWMGNFDGRFYEITCNPTTPPEVTVETLAPKEGDADDDDLRVRVGVSGPNVTPFMLSSSLIKVIVSFTA